MIFKDGVGRDLNVKNHGPFLDTSSKDKRTRQAMYV
jgi:hypothetical protein